MIFSASRLLALGVAALGVGCASPPPDAAPGAAGPASGLTCAQEAEELLEAVAVHRAPEPGSELLERLGRGRFVYRCERRGPWLAVMFPAVHDPIDCATRTAERPCTIGWVEGDLDTAIYG